MIFYANYESKIKRRLLKIIYTGDYNDAKKKFITSVFTYLVIIYKK